MTRKKSAGAGNGRPSGAGVDRFGVSFVNIYLTDGDKEAIGSMELSDQDMFYALERLVEDGYKVSLSIDWNNTGAMCSITGTAGCGVTANTGRCLVSRGPNIRGAICSCLYKLQAYCPGGEFPLSGDYRSGGFA